MDMKKALFDVYPKSWTNKKSPRGRQEGELSKWHRR